ncbi:MAG: Unknown protein [uncultured Sulfurovum sp.]|uniref:Uncharacterized protein n=1 Tax=uncultured Sulfurovum sp. TaxID=269237 RepID=A0A6S6SLQ3_9BACT|nr:MAG: Unknown protein [uncultured Sulfurovum sp.]
MNEEEKEIHAYKFGTGDYNKKIIKAETLDEAVNEFILSCIDFSEFAYKNNPHSDSLHIDPIGFTDGKKNTDCPNFQFYELIPVWEDGKLLREISITEFNNWHIRQNNILEDKSETTDTNNGGVTTSSMVHIGNNILNTSMKIRQIKLNMALERKSNFVSAKDKLSEMQSEMGKIEEEYAMLQKKMGILKTYSGIGRDIVKIRGGETSRQLKIDIFQSFRYMKEDIDILTDFEGFDARDLERFDEFAAKHYKELLPSEKCIQAFKITKQEIKYDDAFMQQSMDQENRKVYILIRNGENVYRVFNDYNLHENYLFVFDEPTEVFGNIAKEMLNTGSSHRTEEYYNIKNSWDAKISGGECKGTHHHSSFSSGSGYVCILPLNYDEDLLAEIQEVADKKYDNERQRREKYIRKYELEDEIDIHSWRWGTSLGMHKRECNREYLEVRHRMELTEAYKKNEHLTLFALSNKSTNVYGYFNNAELKRKMMPHESGVAYTGYDTYRDTSNKNDFSDKFDPMTAEPLIYHTLWYDYDKYKENALTVAREEIEKKFNEQNYKNFNSIAILQNIIDSKNIFTDLPMIDVIFGKGVELLNFIKDGSNLIDHSSTYADPFVSGVELKKGEKVFVIRNSGYQIVRSGHHQEKESRNFKRPQVVLASVASIKDGVVKLKGYFDVYKNYNNEKNISAGNAKISIETLQADWLLIKEDIEKEVILKVLKNRHFRETEFRIKGVALKDILALKRNHKHYNFGGGVTYERY